MGRNRLVTIIVAVVAVLLLLWLFVGIGDDEAVVTEDGVVSEEVVEDAAEEAEDAAD